MDRLAMSFALAAGAFAGLGAAQSPEGTVAGSDTALGDSFGEACAADFDAVVIGARLDDGGKGAAYVFRRTGPATWTEEAKLVPAGAAAGDQAGRSVALDGDLAVLGAPDPFDPFGPASGGGAAYVFRNTGGAWTEDAALVASDGQTLDQLGHSVAVSGTLVAAGARGEQAIGPGSRFSGQGAVYIFEDTGGAWVQQAKIQPPSAPGDRIGESVALDGSSVLFGAPGDDDNGPESGSAFVYVQSGSIWNPQAALLASDGAADDQFGHACGLRGDVAAVGAPFHDGAGADAGAAYVFRRSGTTWAQESKLVASDATPGDNFGASVAVGDGGARVVVGAPGANALYVFEDQGGGVWIQVAKLTETGSIALGYGAGASAEFVVGGDPLFSFQGRASLWCANPGPTLNSISPTSGLFNQNVLVTLDGADFSPVKQKTVTFGGAPATQVTFVSENQLTCLAPTGPQGATVDVSVDQEGQVATLVGAYTYLGVDLQSISPAGGPAVGGTEVTLSGENFVNDGSNVVTFGGVPATIQSVSAPDTIVVTTPPGSHGATVDVTLTSSAGTDTLVGGFTYEPVSILAVHPPAGNLLGGTLVTLTVDPGTNLADTSITLDGQPVTVLSADATTATFMTPAVPEPPGGAVAISLTNSNGTDVDPDGFTYTPSLRVDVTGDVVNGGTLFIHWVTDPAAPGPQFITLWVGDPFIPPLDATVGGIAGKIQFVPILFILQGFPAGAGTVPLNYNPLPASISGFPLHMEALVTGEGKPQGSFTNAAQFIIP